MKVLNKVTIIGVGLIGGSFAKGLKETGLVKTVMGFGQNEATLNKAIELGVVDQVTMDIQQAITGADLVLLAVPLGVMASVLEQMKPYLDKNTIITDAGSAKVSVIESVKAVFGEVPSHFVPGHPIAGKEKSGVAAADSNLYIDHRVILTPLATTNMNALSEVKRLWRLLGANVETMDACRHDEIFAATSHLPHLLAFSLVDMLHQHDDLGNVFPYTAGGFRDFTRIASSDAVMWRDIALTNSTALVKWLNNYQDSLSSLTRLVENKDGEALYKLFDGAKRARDKHIV